MLTIVFATKGIPFCGDSISRGGLGGSETAVLSMARELAAIGNRVTVYCHCPSPGMYDGVRYRDIADFQNQIEIIPCDVLIVSRFNSLLAVPSLAGIRILWMHDVVGTDTNLPSTLFQTDEVFCLSKYHEDRTVGVYPEIRKLLWRTSNGVDLALAENSRRNKVPGKLIYTSRPERGLLLLLAHIFPRILREYDKAVLHVAAYDLKGVKLGSDIEAMHARCDDLIADYGDRVKVLGSLNKQKLYEEISSAELFVYPTSFPEIYCIGALEAQACGTPIVTTGDFALPETVDSSAGRLISPVQPEEDGSRYVDDFVRCTVELLKNREMREACSQAGRRSVESRGLTWRQIAQSWFTHFKEMFAGRSPQRIADTFVVTGDEQAATVLRDKHRLAPSVGRIARQETHKFAPSTMREMVPVWDRLLSVIEVSDAKLRPAKILDIDPGDGLAAGRTFGIYAAAKFAAAKHNVQIDVLHHSSEGASVLKSLLEENRIANVSVLESVESLSDAYDLIYLGHRLEEAAIPSDFADTWMRRYLSDSGVLCGCSRYNLTTERLRLWNLTQADLDEMFSGSKKFAVSLETFGQDSFGNLAGLWCYATGKLSTVRKLSIERKVRQTREYHRVAVCMITKNERDWINGAISSVRQFADQLIIADTGSTDGTPDIISEQLSESGRVLSVPFVDFSQARNASLAESDCDWILVLDADERLHNPGALRKYLDTKLFEGFQLSQHHLAFDVAASRDFPVRLFRSKPAYRFVGRIHEMCEDVSRNPLGEQIEPLFLIPDATLLHYGYVTELQRRPKCSQRNMSLLFEDVRKSPERIAVWHYVIRDYLNAVKWGVEQTGKVVLPDSKEREFLDACIETFWCKFSDPNARYRQVADHHYQEALTILGTCGLETRQFRKVPFCVQLQAEVISQKSEAKPSLRWFSCNEEFEIHMRNMTRRAVGMTDAIESFSPVCQLPDPVVLLKSVAGKVRIGRA